jgi:chromosome partitioning protein
MKITTIATQKGGAGKTTIATNLAVASAKAGYLTMLIDTDSRQKTALEWFNKRDDQENPIVIEAEDQKTLESLLNMAKDKKIDRIFIDTQGAETNLVNFAIKSADFCLLPCSSGGFDIGAQRTTAQTVQRLNKDAAFIITKAPSRGQEAIETKAILSGLGLQVAPHQTTMLKIYKDAALFNSSVIEFDSKSKATLEIQALQEWLEKKLNKSPLLKELQGAANHA